LDKYLCFGTPAPERKCRAESCISALINPRSEKWESILSNLAPDSGAFPFLHLIGQPGVLKQKQILDLAAKIKFQKPSNGWRLFRVTNFCFSIPYAFWEPLFLAQAFDIFRIQVEGGVRWIGSVENMEAAKALIKAESAKQPGDFLVVNLQTGRRVEIKADPAA